MRAASASAGSRSSTTRRVGTLTYALRACSVRCSQGQSPALALGSRVAVGGGAAGDVGAGADAAAHPGDRDGAAGPVQGPVTAAVEPVPHCSAAAGRDQAG